GSVRDVDDLGDEEHILDRQWRRSGTHRASRLTPPCVEELLPGLLIRGLFGNRGVDDRGCAPLPVGSYTCSAGSAFRVLQSGWSVPLVLAPQPDEQDAQQSVESHDRPRSDSPPETGLVLATHETVQPVSSLRSS